MFRSTIRLVCLGLVLLSLAGLVSCNRRDKAIDRLAEDASSADGTDSSLTFRDITLEQVDEKGKLVWKVRAAEARYSQDQKIAKVKNPSGELYQDGKLVFEIKADQGEVQQDGQKIFLTGQITATDKQDGVVMKGRELEWRPQEDQLVVRNTLTASHPKVVARANEVRAYSRSRRMEFFGKVTAVSKDPSLKLQTEYLEWLIGQQLIKGNKPLLAERLIQNKVTDRASGDQTLVNLKTKVVKITRNARFILSDPTMEMVSNSVLWNVDQQTIAADQPLTLKDEQSGITVSSDRGQMDLDKRIVYLVNNVRGTANQNQGKLAANLLTWSISDRLIEVEGNVVYQQSNPTVSVMGPRAIGHIEDQTLVMTGGRVTTEIIP